AAIREALARQLPDYMVPAALVVLETLPTSANGKLDRKALPPPERRDHDRPVRAPPTVNERIVVTLFADVLGTTGRSDAGEDAGPSRPSAPVAIGIDDDFFSLGGHSLLAAQLMNRLRSRFGVDGGLGVVFAHPTAARLADYVDRTSG